MEILNVWWKNIDGSFRFGDGYTNSTEYSLATEQEIAQIINDQLNEEQLASKWKKIDNFKNSLIVTVQSGNVFAANPSSLLNIGFKVLNPIPQNNIEWKEDWGYFYTTTLELQEVLTEADRLNQEYLKSIFGAI